MYVFRTHQTADGKWNHSDHWEFGLFGTEAQARRALATLHRYTDELDRASIVEASQETISEAVDWMEDKAQHGLSLGDTYLGLSLATIQRRCNTGYSASSIETV